jgi:hypothetical protein
MSEDRFDALLDAWREEHERANRAERRVAELEIAAAAIVHADRIEQLEAALLELERLVLGTV